MQEIKSLKSAPESWLHRLVLSSVPKDGEPFEESFSLDVDAPVDYWSQLYRMTKPLDVHVEASRVNARILVQISIASEAETSCSRCLEPAKGIFIHCVLPSTRMRKTNMDKMGKWGLYSLTRGRMKLTFRALSGKRL